MPDTEVRPLARAGAALGTVVGVLVEVPVMLALVRFANYTSGAFETRCG